MLKMQKIIIWVLTGLLLLGLVGYAFFVFSPVLSRPKITITTPANGEIVSGEDVIVRGEVKNVTKLYLNNVQLPVSKSGTFEGRLGVWEDSTILVLEGVDRFGRIVTVSRIVGK